MNRKQFLDLVKELGVPFSEYTENGADIIYVFSKKEYELKKKHPRKYKDLFVPYLRVSHFYEYTRWYVRDCGLTGYRNPSDVIKQVKEMALAE